MVGPMFIIGFFFVALGLYARFGAGFPVNQIVTQKTNLFTSTGEGKVTVVPDTGIISLGVNTQASSVKIAQDQANASINQLSAALRSLGIDAKDIKTSNYSIYPQYDYTTGRNRITGYQVNINLTVRVRNLDMLNQAIDLAAASGINQVGGIQLTVDEDKQKDLLKQAREEAVKDAKDKAEALAKAAGITLGRIVDVQESGGLGQPVPMMARAMAEDSKAGVPTQIEPGTTEITTMVTLSYETR